jgi:hypothetical protein
MQIVASFFQGVSLGVGAGQFLDEGNIAFRDFHEYCSQFHRRQQYYRINHASDDSANGKGPRSLERRALG